MEHNGRIAYETIVAAKNGDTEAICEILRHYERYICHFAKQKGALSQAGKQPI